MLVTPPQNPLALTRMWCVWELFCAAERNCEVFVHTSGRLHAAFQAQFMEKKALKSMIANLSSAVISENSVSSDAAHGAMLRSCLRRAGFQHIDSRVSYMLRKWLALRGRMLVEKLLRTTDEGDRKDNMR